MATLREIHESLYSKFRQHNINLELTPQAGSVTDGQRTPALVYTRPQGEALNIERMMGSDTSRMTINRHPVIEIRQSPAGLVVELVMPPSAWFYQQNLIGKLSIARQLEAFHRIVSRLDLCYCLGFWQGTALDDMHLTPYHLAHRLVLEKWMATYTDGRDFFRIGVWYDTDEVPMEEVFNRLKELVTVYDFIAWTGNNDFRAFYQQRSAYA